MVNHWLLFHLMAIWLQRVLGSMADYLLRGLLLTNCLSPVESFILRIFLLPFFPFLINLFKSMVRNGLWFFFFFLPLIFLLFQYWKYGIFPFLCMSVFENPHAISPRVSNPMHTCCNFICKTLLHSPNDQLAYYIFFSHE